MMLLLLLLLTDGHAGIADRLLILAVATIAVG